MLPPAQLPLERFPFMDHPWAQRKRVFMARMAEQTLLTREAGSDTRLATEVFFDTQGLRLTPRMTLGSNEAVKHAIAAGLGVVVLSPPCIGS